MNSLLNWSLLIGLKVLIGRGFVNFYIFCCNNFFSMSFLGNPYALQLVNHEANLVRCIIWNVLCVEFFPDLFRDLFLHVYTRYYLVSFPSVSSHGCFISWMNILICMFWVYSPWFPKTYLWRNYLHVSHYLVSTLPWTFFKCSCHSTF